MPVTHYGATTEEIVETFLRIRAMALAAGMTNQVPLADAALGALGSQNITVAAYNEIVATIGLPPVSPGQIITATLNGRLVIINAGSGYFTLSQQAAAAEAAAAAETATAGSIIRSVNLPLMVYLIGNEIRLTAQLAFEMNIYMNQAQSILGRIDTLNTYRLDSAASCAAARQTLANIQQDMRNLESRFRQMLNGYSAGASTDDIVSRLMTSPNVRYSDLKAKIDRVCGPIDRLDQIRSEQDSCKNAYTAAVQAALATIRAARANTWENPLDGREVQRDAGERADAFENFLRTMANQLQAGSTTTDIAKNDVSRVVGGITDGQWISTHPLELVRGSALNVYSNAVKAALRGLLAAMQSCPPPILPPIQYPTLPVIMS